MELIDNIDVLGHIGIWNIRLSEIKTDNNGNEYMTTETYFQFNEEILN